jgi:small subunit ribosomal protein S8
MNNPIVDLIIRIKNGYMTRNEFVYTPYSHFREEVVKKLKTLGYIKDYEVTGEKVKDMKIVLSYKEGIPAITDVKVFSTSGTRKYISYKDIKPVLSGMGKAFISTSKGIMTDVEIKKMKIGGELLFALW